MDGFPRDKVIIDRQYDLNCLIGSDTQACLNPYIDLHFSGFRKIPQHK